MHGGRKDTFLQFFIEQLCRSNMDGHEERVVGQVRLNGRESVFDQLMALCQTET